MSATPRKIIATALLTITILIAGPAVASAYTVRPGDTLSEIAAEHHTTWPDLYATNRSMIGPDPDLILPGQVLTLDGTPARTAHPDTIEKESTAQVATEGGLARTATALPVDDYRITATFGASGRHWSRTHTGLDFAAPCGTPVRAVAAGTVTAQGRAGAYGQRVLIDHGSVASMYAHLSGYGSGGHVDAGDVVGYVGTTGNSTGCHLHLEIHDDGTAVDPHTWLTARGITP